MTKMSDVRKALWKAYQKENESDGGLEGKSAEGSCELIYPTYWDCENQDDFLEPIGLMVYSYALGPSRQHYFYKGNKESHKNYYTWVSKDFLAKAVEVINDWSK